MMHLKRGLHAAGSIVWLDEHEAHAYAQMIEPALEPGQVALKPAPIVDDTSEKLFIVRHGFVLYRQNGERHEAGETIMMTPREAASHMMMIEEFENYVPPVPVLEDNGIVKTYRVRAGFHPIFRGNNYQSGDTLNLNGHQARLYAHMIEPVPSLAASIGSAAGRARNAVKTGNTQAAL